MSKPKWLVKFDKEPIEPKVFEFELSVVKRGTHGENSWGWPGDDKIVLLSGVCGEEYSAGTVKLVKEMAKKLCERLNG